jgi:hypothetical protein
VLRCNSLGSTQGRGEGAAHLSPIRAAQSRPRRCSPQGDIKLMPQEQVLSLKPASRLEQIAGEQAERVEQGKHHAA